MLEYAFVPIRRSRFPNSYAMLSRAKGIDTAAVFVHGFAGDAYTTWQEFQPLINELQPLPERWRGADLFFFDYPAARRGVDPGVRNLEAFLNQIIPSLDATLFEDGIELGSSRPALYSHLIFVAHSQGAVVVRDLVRRRMHRLTLSLKQHPDGDRKEPPNQEKLLLNAELRLLAPAHLGFRPSGIKAVVQSSPNLGAYVRALLSYFPAVDDLGPESATILDLKRKTEEFALEFPDVSALRAHVLWGELESLVKPGQYDYDVSYPDEREKGHVDICKPRRRYLRPLEFVLNQRAKPHVAGQ